MSRVAALPDALKNAMARAPRAKAAFERLARSHQREYVQWIADAKRPETRARRAAETVKRLAGRRKPEAGHR